MNIETLVAYHDKLDETVSEASEKLNRICKPYIGPMGLVDDEFRKTAEYRIANDDYKRAFQELRAFNVRANRIKPLREFLDDRSRARRFKKA